MAHNDFTLNATTDTSNQLHYRMSKSKLILTSIKLLHVHMPRCKTLRYLYNFINVNLLLVLFLYEPCFISTVYYEFVYCFYILYAHTRMYAHILLYNACMYAHILLYNAYMYAHSYNGMYIFVFVM